VFNRVSLTPLLNSPPILPLAVIPLLSLQGLLLLPKNSSQVQVVSNRVSLSSPLEPGSPIVYANDLDIDSQGMIYFTTSVDTPLHRCVTSD
jgi:sugar lactone lactonase YvrE